MQIEQTYLDELIDWRRQFHRHPEEGWTEFETTYKIVKQLESLGFEVLKGRQVINPKAVMGRLPAVVEAAKQRALSYGIPAAFFDAIEDYTGAVGILRTGRPGPVLAVRCDIDCVKVAETTSADHLPNKEGFASEHPGLMHSCGHDAHAAVGLVFCRWLAEHKDELCGTIKVIFQPAEEGVRGAAAMEKAGVVNDVDLFVGAHVGCEAPPNEVVFCPNGFLASTKIDLKFKGQASHAGSDPEKGKNALLAACHAAIMMTGISRHSQGATRISVGTLHAGEGRNVVPAVATMEIETRGKDKVLNEFVRDNALRMAQSAADAFDVTLETMVMGEASNLVVDLDFTEELRQFMESIGVRAHSVYSEAGSEDCSAFTRNVLDHGGKSAFFLYGSNLNGHHTPAFDLRDEAGSLSLGFGAYVAIAKRYAGKDAQ